LAGEDMAGARMAAASGPTDAPAPRRRAGRLAFAALALATAALAALLATGGGPAGSEPSRTPEQTVDAFHDALRGADAAMALSLLGPDATVFELGRTDASRRDYAALHLSNDMKLAAGGRRELLSRKRGELGAGHWVMSTYRWTGQGEAAKPATTLAETVVLRRDGGQWKIVHVHWSVDGAGPANP
jgi:ketosteroid isomerase-like protein